MQTFIDTYTNEVWSFEDDVIAADIAGIYTFSTAEVASLHAPSTLQPYTVPAPAPLTAEEQFTIAQKNYQDAVQDYIISIAQAKGYRDDVSCASYFNDPHEPFMADAQAFVPWRSSVWLQCYTDLAAIQAGTMPMPASPAAYILTLPAVPAGF
jgi:hypothetical protein